MRADGRTPLQLRPITIETGFQKHAEGSVRIKFGDTHVSCAASVERGVPGFLVGKGTGWVTAEYAMLPRSTHTRSKRDPGGRGKEIQRLIGRALRQAIDLSKLGEYTIHIDCDVLQADGGTRVASITGAWVALALALETMQKRGWIADLSALSPPVAAVSVGIIDGEVRVDLPYEEDSRATVDMNVVMDHNGQLIEVQGTGEHGTFSRAQMNELLDAASVGITDLIKHQLAAVPFWRAK